MNKKRPGLYTKSQISQKYGLSLHIIEKYFPAPILKRNMYNKSKPREFWTEDMISRALKTPEIIREIEVKKKKEKKARARAEELAGYLSRFDIERFVNEASALERRFILHIGPTNSGKTYSALEALKKSGSGMYLGPLRLLALEMFDSLNADGIYCSLLTGEEHIEVPGASFTASTIELCDYEKEVDIAVIDEAQMITDKDRGDRWLKAIYLVKAKEVHICAAPESKDLLLGILKSFNAPYEIKEHVRLAPLIYKGYFESFEDTAEGDAFIVFSRRAVLSVAAALEELGIKASVIYGALPPGSRREEIRKFENHETTVVVATDAIGMGVSLPIRRVIFCEDSKFDGQRTRKLLSAEVKQIAGRAGRFGIYDTGYVMTMTDSSVIERGLLRQERQNTTLTIPFPEEALLSGYKINELLLAWQQLPKVPGINRANMSDALKVFKFLDRHMKKGQKKLVYQLINCPFDVENESLLSYWYECSLAILYGGTLPSPRSGTDSLEECETRYRELDIRHQLLRIVGIEEDRMQEKKQLCEKINYFLTQDKNAYIRHCRSCGRMLPPTHKFTICEECYMKGY